MRIGIVLHPMRNCSQPIATIAEWGEQHGVEVVLRSADRARAPDGMTVVDDAELAATATGLVSLGGDGTMLGALRLAADVERPVPVLGVNFGRLGFLAEVEPEELPDALDRLAAEDFTIEPRACLDISAAGDDAIAFNDLALCRVPGAGFVQAALTVDGHRHGYFRCDALIVATPSGSTAYSYAAGGPVVSPAAQGVLVTPASPMTGISRPVFLSPDEALRLELIDGSGQPALEIDGTVERQLDVGDVVDIRIRPDAGHVVRLDAPAYYERNRVKLSLLDLPLLPHELRQIVPPPE